MQGGRSYPAPLRGGSALRLCRIAPLDAPENDVQKEAQEDCAENLYGLPGLDTGRDDCDDAHRHRCACVHHDGDHDAKGDPRDVHEHLRRGEVQPDPPDG